MQNIAEVSWQMLSDWGHEQETQISAVRKRFALLQQFKGLGIVAAKQDA